MGCENSVRLYCRQGLMFGEENTHSGGERVTAPTYSLGAVLVTLVSRLAAASTARRCESVVFVTYLANVLVVVCPMRRAREVYSIPSTSRRGPPS